MFFAVKFDTSPGLRPFHKPLGSAGVSPSSREPKIRTRRRDASAPRNGAPFEAERVKRNCRVATEFKNAKCDYSFHATETQFKCGAAVCVQFRANAGLTTANRLPSTAPADNRVLMNFMDVLPKSLTEAVSIMFFR